MPENFFGMLNIYRNARINRSWLCTVCLKQVRNSDKWMFFAKSQTTRLEIWTFQRVQLSSIDIYSQPK